MYLLIPTALLQTHSGTASQINGPQLEPWLVPGIDAAYIVTK